MEIEETTPTESTETVETPEVVEAPAPESTPVESGGSTGEEPATEGDPAPDAAPPVAANAYTPNHKFTAWKKEYEFDDWAKPLVTNKETEEKFRTLYAKAYGLEQMKEEKETYKRQLDDVTPKYKEASSTLELVTQLATSKDLPNLFQSLGLTPQDIAQYVILEAEKQNMDPAQRQAMERDNQIRLQYLNQNKRLGEYEQREIHAGIAQRDQVIGQLTNQPGVSNFVSQYESVNGQGAWHKAVVNEGFMHFLETGGDPKTGQGGQNLSPQEAFDRALKRSMYQPQQATNTQVTQVTRPNAPTPPPNLGKSGHSTGTKPIRSLKDIKQYRQQNYGQ